MVVLFVIGRIIFGLYFIYNAYNHFRNIAIMSRNAKAKGVPLAPLAVVITGLLLLGGGLSMLFGVYPVLGIIFMFVFLVPVSFIIHNYWAIENPQKKMVQQINFLKNMALIGALLMFFMINRPWPVSVYLG
jgi:putative oxidoreductase